MKFTVPSNELQKSLAKVSGVVPSKSTLPILENILFRLSKNVLQLASTDLEVSMSALLDVKGSEDGSIAVPAKRLMETIRALPDIQLVFNADLSSNKVRMITEMGEYVLMGESSEEFPTIPQVKGEDKITLTGDVLRALIHRTVFAVSSDELRPAMTGVLLQVRDGQLRAVSTDGHRLVRLQYSGMKQPKLQWDIIVPAKALNLVSKSVENETNTLAVDANHVQFTFGTTTLTSRVIEESYPNYESVIPGDNDKRLAVGRDLLLAAVRRVALYSSSTTHQVRCSLRKNELRVMAEDIDFGGEAKEKVPCDYSGEELEIGFNSTYLIDILSHLDGEEAEFKLGTSVRAAIITPAHQKPNEDLLMLVMPMRLNT
ncbi:MAG TPA: DNA polymerase III subunit beta [Bacteroidetes bacterium]|nr:DNA polymerase III subunit beta [Bacteroidota bacterium]